MLSLTFDRRDFVTLSDNTFRWIDIKHFTFQPHGDVNSDAMLASLIDNWRYRDNYAGANSHEEDSQTIHGPFLVASIKRSDFTPIDPTRFSGVIQEFLSLHDNHPTAEKQNEIDDVLLPLRSVDAKYFQLTKSLDADIHDWGFVLWEFRELVAIDFSRGHVALCVMAID